MSAIELRQKIQKEISDADEHILKAILAMLKEYNKSQSSYKLSDEQLHILRERKARYESGKSRGYTWNEVKERLKPKKK